MENIRITTAQNVGIQYELASLGDRALAFLIDYIGIKVLYGVLCYLVYEFLQSLSTPVEVPNWAIICLVVLPLLLYDLVMEITNDGQTIGKRILSIKVVMLDGSRPTVVAFLLRWVFRMIELDSSLGSLALWFYLFSAKGQRLGDMAAGTTVVKLRKEDFSSTIFEEIDNAYTPRFSEAAVLSDSEAGIIREILASVNDNQSSRAHFDAIALETQRRIAYRLGISTDMEAYAFLDHLLKDYNHLHSLQN